MKCHLGEGTHDTLPCRTEHVIRANQKFKSVGATEMKNTSKPLNIGTQVRVGTRTNSVVKFLPILLFVALVTALAFTG
jgi:hypothetical protein